MTNSERIAELERRVAELEGERRYYTVPIPQPFPSYPYPYMPAPQPTWPGHWDPMAERGSVIVSQYTNNTKPLPQ